jgi:RsiW-degrading membrane proteinase PrsW (M82 family)
VIGAAIAPLLIVTLRSDLQLTAFSMLFAFIWGMVFKHYIVRTTVSWTTLVAALFFTGLVGIRAPLLLSQIYMPFAFSANVLVSMVGFVFGVGVCEELCKVIPVLAYLFWKRRDADPKTCISICIFSGLGFAAFENLHYQGIAIGNALQHTKDLDQYGLGEIGLREGVREAMVDVLLRSLSLVFCHALWTGIVGYFLTISFLTGRRYAVLAVTGILFSATIHGTYDWLIVSIQQQTLAAAVMAGTFVLFYAYLLKLEALTGKLPDGE